MIGRNVTGFEDRYATARRFLVLVLAAVVVLVMVGTVHFQANLRVERAARLSSESLNVTLGRSAIARDLGGVVTDLTYLAGQYRNHVFGPEGSVPAVVRDFSAFLSEKRTYDQLRYLDASGWETLRINYLDGNPVVVPAGELQNKADRYYFERAWRLAPGEVYVSPLDLNVEHGRVEQPHKPMIRFATVVADARGEKRGILLLNYLGENLLREFRASTANISDHVMLLNGEGYWLSSPRRDEEWAFMFGEQRTFAAESPEAWSRVSQEESGQFRGDDGVYTFATVRPLGRPRDKLGGTSVAHDGDVWKVVAHLSPDALDAIPQGFFRRHLPLYGMMLALLVVAAAVITRTTERHRRAEAQVDFERRFREILENVDLLAVGLDRSGAVVFCNKALAGLLDRTGEDVAGHDWFDAVVAEERRGEERERFHRAVSGGDPPVRHTYEICTPGGQVRAVSWNDTPLRGADGRVIGLTCIGEDVTERRKAEEELRKLSSAVEQSPSTVMITDTEGRIEYVNRKFTALTGYTLDEVRGRNPRFLKSGHTTPDKYRELWRTVSDGGEWRGIFHNVKKNGDRYWEAATICAIRDADGRIAHFLAVKEDITDRVSLADRFRRVVEAAPYAMVMVKGSGEIVMVNSQTEKLFGYDREALMGSPVEMLVPEDTRGKHPGLRAGFMREPGSREMGRTRNLRALRADGSTFPVEVGLSAIEMDGESMVLAAVVDISRRRRLESELEQRNREFAKAQSLAVAGRMAAMVAHDMRNPLSSIKMALQILGRQASGEGETEEHELTQIGLDQVRYMESILSDLLAYCRESTLSLEWVQLDRLIDAAVLLTQKPISDHGVDVQTRHQPGLPNLYGDPDKLRQAFSNLIMNAIQACEPIKERTPQVTISTHLQLAPDRPQVRVEIRDNGEGIGDADAEKLFEPFHTTRAKGTGLGLAIVKRIVNQHNGTVSICPDEGAGTCVSVVLPTGPVDERAGVTVEDPASRAGAEVRADLVVASDVEH